MCRCVDGLVVPDVSKDPNASSRVKRSKNLFSLVLLGPQDEGTTILRNVGKRYPNERHTATHPKRLKRLTERATHGNTSPKRRKRLTERVTRGNTSPKRRERLTERATHGTNISETSENDSPNERHTATHLRRPASSLANGCFRRKQL